MIKVIKKILTIFIKILLVFLFILIVLFFISKRYACENEIKKIIYSPNVKYKVTVFQRDCGATTGFTTHVYLSKSSKNINNSVTGNILIVTGEVNCTIKQIRWINDHTIFIKLKKLDKRDIYEKNKNYCIGIFDCKNIKVIYKK